MIKIVNIQGLDTPAKCRAALDESNKSITDALIIIDEYRSTISELEQEVSRLRGALEFYEDKKNWVLDHWVEVDVPAEIPSTRIRFNEDHEVCLLSRSTGLDMKNRRIKYTGFGPAIDFGKRARKALGRG